MTIHPDSVMVENGKKYKVKLPTDASASSAQQPTLLPTQSPIASSTMPTKSSLSQSKVEPDSEFQVDSSSLPTRPFELLKRFVVQQK